MNKILTAVFVFAASVLTAVAVHVGPAVGAGAAIISDPAGDATGFVVEGVLPLPNEPSLDIRTANLAVSRTTLTATIELAGHTTSAPQLSSGRTFRWDFTYGARAYELQADAPSEGAPSVTFSDPDGDIACAACTIAVTPGAVTMTLPLRVLNQRVAASSRAQAGPVGPGGKLYRLAVIAQRTMGVITATADSAVTDVVYLVPNGARSTAPSANDERGDAVVIAVIDINMVPYHWDFDWLHMPQQLDADKTNDLPLTTPPDKWLPGFPDRSTFKSFQSLPIHQAPTAPEASIATLDAADTKTWNKVKTSTPESINYYWLPGTKVIGAVEFNTDGHLHGTTDDHGVGVASVSVGNLHGTCPECLLMFINTDDSTNVEAALAWATRQPWIDVITNSYTLNILADDLQLGEGGDNVHLDRPVAEDTLAASVRGQTLLFAAGNGFENAFLVPNQTYLSSLSGPDWVVTVGGTTPDMDDYVGAGKPVDVGGMGDEYPSAYTAERVGGTGSLGFSGTSNATPTVAGIYARALYQARRALPGPSRMQQGGVIARGNKPFTCGSARPACELGDGALTADELRTRLFLGAPQRDRGVGVTGLLAVPKPSPEVEFADVGHGAFAARGLATDRLWIDEVEGIVGPLVGRAPAKERPAGEREWMIVDSYCRQQLWGPWSGGYYVDGRTALPGPDPAWPVRSALETLCSAMPAM